MDRIERGLRPGDQLPTEHALCEEFSVSRETVRAALGTLEQDGLIERARGRGTFVARLPRRRPERRLTGMAEDYSALNLDTEARVLGAGVARVPGAIADALGAEAEELFRITRLRSFEGEPLAWHEAWLPLDLGPRIAALDLRRTSIERELRETLRVPMWEDQQSIEAVAADVPVASLLGVPVGAPLLHLTRLYLRGTGDMAVHFRSLYRPDRYYYTVKLAQPVAPPRRRRG